MPTTDDRPAERKRIARPPHDKARRLGDVDDKTDDEEDGDDG